MSGKNYSPGDYWPAFSAILKMFNLLGIMPVSIERLKEKDSERLEIRFSRVGFIMASIFLILTLIHCIWAPMMLIKLEKSIVASFLDSGKMDKNVTLGSKSRTLNTKLAGVVKVLHPILVSVTTLSARSLSVFILAKSMPVLFKAFARVDKLLSLPSTFYLSNFASLSSVTAFSFVLHVPVTLIHLWKTFPFRDFWEDIWEGFSMLNVFTSFALELEFVLFCISIRSRFGYINSLLVKLVSEEFLYDDRIGGRLKKIFSKWKDYVGPRNKKVFSSLVYYIQLVIIAFAIIINGVFARAIARSIRDSVSFDSSANDPSTFSSSPKPKGNIKAKEELFKLFSKMDAANGGKYLPSHDNVCLIDVIGRRKKAPEPETSNLFKSLRSGHILLFDVLQHLNDLYQVHLLVTIFSSVSEILFNFYFTIFGFVSSGRNVPQKIKNEELFLINLWSVYYGFRFMLIVNFAHLAASASKEAGKIISKIDPREFELTSKQEIKMFSDHLSRRDFEFSACGLFNLNTSLISTSFSTGITYLVIMAQFH